MIRAVIDLNVIISALISSTGAPALVWAAWTDGERFDVIISEGMLDELAGKLASPRIADRYGIRSDDALAVNALLWTAGTLVAVSEDDVEPVTGDPEDDLVLATARLGRADCLVTGDRRLLALARYGQVIVVSPRDFLTLLDEPVE
jgi:putative PIN family toxin of toxin-antitoxin system